MAALRFKSPYKIAVIPGDGIGKEVVPVGVRILQACAKKYGFEVQLEHFDFASCDYYERHAKMLPDDWVEVLSRFDALFFGAVGDPKRVPDHISLWGSLLLFRRQFDQYVNLRPARSVAGVPGPLRNPGKIDFWIVRENTEGEYTELGGKIFHGTQREMVVQETVMTRVGIDVSIWLECYTMPHHALVCRIKLRNNATDAPCRGFSSTPSISPRADLPRS